MSDMLDPDAIFEDPIENLEWITDQRDNMQTRPLLDFWRSEGITADPVDYSLDASFERMRHPIAECAAGICRNLAKVGYGAA
jgi:hypothetical protein